MGTIFCAIQSPERNSCDMMGAAQFLSDCTRIGSHGEATKHILVRLRNAPTPRATENGAGAFECMSLVLEETFFHATLRDCRHANATWDGQREKSTLLRRSWLNLA